MPDDHEVQPSSPLPWAYHGESEIVSVPEVQREEEEHASRGVSYVQTVVCTIPTRGTHAIPMRPADARYIVKACNEYQALRADNERLRNAMEGLAGSCLRWTAYNDLAGTEDEHWHVDAEALSAAWAALEATDA